MKSIKLFILFYIILFFGSSFSQEMCSNDLDCGAVDDECAYRYCDLSLQECVTAQKECNNGLDCLGTCVTDESTCEEKQCVASEDPVVDRTCQISYLECPKPANFCKVSYCAITYGGCREFENECFDHDGCTNDMCDPINQVCINTPIDNCIPCDTVDEKGCITTDLCFPQICVGIFRGGGPSQACIEDPVICNTTDPCISAYCKDGVCQYDNICSSESTTSVSTTSGITGVATTTSIATTSGTTGVVTTLSDTTTISSTTSPNCDDYHGPKYPNCLNCEDLGCKNCKYLKVKTSNCWEKYKNNYHKDHHGKENHHGNHHHKSNHDNPHHEKQHHSSSIGGNLPPTGQFYPPNTNGIGSGTIGNNNNNNNCFEDYSYFPSRLSDEDCCPYTPTCF